LIVEGHSWVRLLVLTAPLQNLCDAGHHLARNLMALQGDIVRRCSGQDVAQRSQWVHMLSICSWMSASVGSPSTAAEAISVFSSM
jgi:hypothetical protein